MKHWRMQFNVAGGSERTDCFDFEMIIDNCSMLKDVLNSPTFTTTQDCKTVWQIVVEVSLEKKQMRVGLKRTDSNKCHVKASMFYEIQNDKSEVYWRDSVEHIYKTESAKDFFSGYRDMPSHHYCVFGLKGRTFKLSSDKIILKGHVLVREQVFHCERHKMHHKFLAECVEDLKNDYKCLYNNPNYSDIEFRFPDGKLHAHKCILGSRSPFLKWLFEQNCSTTYVDVTDVKKSVFDVFLQFLYTGVFEKRNTDVILPLYDVACKYRVNTLSKICSNMQASEISVETATRTLELANKYNDTSLTEAAIVFVCGNFLEISQTSDWKNFISSNPRVASTVLRRVSESLESLK